MSSPTSTNVTSFPNGAVRNDPLDEPPPYTPRADMLQGETTVEYGPLRPFQPPPPQPQPPPRPAQAPTFLTPQPTGPSFRPGGRGGSLLRQLSDQIDQIASQIVERHATGSNSRHRLSPQPTGWSSYPGQSTGRSPYNAPPGPPPTHVTQPQRRPSSSSVSLPSETSDFARDFYSAGPGEELLSGSGGNRISRSNGTSDDRGPTTTPVPGRPLLREGQLLIYPKGYTCEKCHNTGYKHYDPLRPCKKCWHKYGKPFTGPVAYSYSSPSSTSNTQNINLQRPLPLHVPSAPRSAPPPLPPRRRSSLGAPTMSPTMSPRNDYNTWRPAATTVSVSRHPPPGAAVYRAGDPRIGGNLCWSCNGKGTMSIIIDTINCPVCGGSGRTFY